MRRVFETILPIVVLLAAIAAPVRADGDADAPADDDRGAPLRRAPVGSIARQMEMKLSLLRTHGGGTLTASLDHAEEEWNALSPDQRELFRRKTLAFLQKNPQDRKKLIESYRTFIDMNKAQRKAFVSRAKWLKVVVASFTAEQRDELRKMDPEDRAAALLERKNELIRSGELKIEDPTTQPDEESEKDSASTQPAS